MSVCHASCRHASCLGNPSRISTLPRLSDCSSIKRNENRPKCHQLIAVKFVSVQGCTAVCHRLWLCLSPPLAYEATSRTVQSWMGHTDLASTTRYLRPARGEKVQAQVEALWASASGAMKRGVSPSILETPIRGEAEGRASCIPKIDSSRSRFVSRILNFPVLLPKFYLHVEAPLTDSL
jgi:hypothetical protein